MKKHHRVEKELLVLILVFENKEKFKGRTPAETRIEVDSIKVGAKLLRRTPCND